VTDRPRNPFRPGFNQAPAVLAGRDDVLDAAREALAIAGDDGRTPRPLVLVGSRGVGKTVLVGEIAALAAEERGWVAAHVEVRARGAFVGQLVERLGAVAALFSEPMGERRRFEVATATARLGVPGASAEVGLARRAAAAPPDDLALEHALSVTIARVVEQGSGLVLTLDEAQLARPDELGELAATLQQHVPDDWPLVTVVAGLPSLREPGRAVTYLERGEWHELGLLAPDDTRYALCAPAAAAGRPIDDDAADVLVGASGGYPYAVQVLGHHAWRASSGAARIALEHARDAVGRADRDLAAGLYASRWQDAAPKERDYLAVLARQLAAGEDATGGSVAAALGAAPRDVSYLRDRLLKKGTIVAQGRSLRFPVPGMAEWVIDHVGESAG
jgi:hypothetical protein